MQPFVDGIHSVGGEGGLRGDPIHPGGAGHGWVGEHGVRADEGGDEVPVAGQATLWAGVTAVMQLFGDAGGAQAALGPGGVPGGGPDQPAIGQGRDLGSFPVDGGQQRAGGEGVDAAAPPPCPHPQVTGLGDQVRAVGSHDAGGGGPGAGVSGLSAGGSVGGGLGTQPLITSRELVAVVRLHRDTRRVGDTGAARHWHLHGRQAGSVAALRPLLLPGREPVLGGVGGAAGALQGAVTPPLPQPFRRETVRIGASLRDLCGAHPATTVDRDGDDGQVGHVDIDAAAPVQGRGRLPAGHDGRGGVAGGEDHQVRLVAPPTQCARVAIPDQVDLVPAARVGEVVLEYRPAARTLREADRQRQVPGAGAGQHDGEGAVVVPPRPHRLSAGGGGDGGHPPWLPQPPGPVEHRVMPHQGPGQTERLPLPRPGMRTRPPRNTPERPPATDLRPAVPAPGRVGEQVPVHGLPHTVSDMHRHGFRAVAAQVRGTVQVSVRGILQSRPGQPQPIPHRSRTGNGSRAVRCPVRIYLGAGVALDCPPHREHRREHPLHMPPHPRIMDIQRQP
ncbi:hypothetical protein [Dactylosporangium sp. CA-233914]|uniref:hypothetical protein n=1 Tax=Dactylosporangium sp. CA-233914 TaxID=3239934 RepID=UPI003D93B54E